MGEFRAQAGSRPVAAALAFLAAAMLLALAVQRPADADVSGITASAYGYTTNVEFAGGAPTRRGFGQTIPPGTAESASPSVSCPATGSPLQTVTDTNGAIAIYGPAVLFGGEQTGETAPPSGPLTVSCQGTTGPAGSASSSADVINVGPGPFIADEVHSTCTATETGLGGTTTIAGGILETSTNPSTGEPTSTFPVPTSPDANLTVTGTINHVGDSFRAVFNEQILSGNGTVLTVNAVHLYLLGPFARGDVIIGSSTCGVQVTQTTTTAGNTTTTAGNTTTTAGNTTTTVGNTTTTAGNTTTTVGNTTTTVGNTTTTGGPGAVPSDKDQCKDGGYAAYGFRNQGECVSFVVSNRGGS